MKVEICKGLIFIVDKDGQEFIFRKKFINYIRSRGQKIHMYFPPVTEVINMDISEFWILYKANFN
jgi:hypothetical protein